MVIDRQVGRGAVLDEAINDMLPKKYIEALEDNDLTPLAQPEIEVTKLEDNEALEFTAEVDVRPEIDAAGVRRPRGRGRRHRGHRRRRRGAGAGAARAVRHAERRRAPGRRRRLRRARPQGHPGRRDRRGRRGGRHVLPGRPRRHDRRPRRGPGRHDRRRGEDVHDPAGRRRPRRQDVEVAVSVSQVQEQELPELDDDFAQMASEFDTVDELTADVRERLAAASGSSRPRPPATPCSRCCWRRSRSRCPRRIVTDELNARRQSVEQQLAYAGMTMESVPRRRGPDGRGVRGRPGEAGPRRGRRPVPPRRGREEGGARRRPERALPAPGPSRPAVRPGPAGVRQPHVRAQPRARDGPGDPARQGAGDDRRVGRGQGR